MEQNIEIDKQICNSNKIYTINFMRPNVIRQDLSTYINSSTESSNFMTKSCNDICKKLFQPV